MTKTANSLAGYIYSSPAAARPPLQGWVGDRSIKKPYRSEKARPLFGMSCESIKIKKKVSRGT